MPHYAMHGFPNSSEWAPANPDTDFSASCQRRKGYKPYIGSRNCFGPLWQWPAAQCAWPGPDPPTAAEVAASYWV